MDPATRPDVPDHARGDCPGALDALLAQSREKLLKLIRRRLGPGLRPYLEPGDILQITLVRALERMGQFRGTSRQSLRAWLASIAVNVIRDEANYLRRQRRSIVRTVPLGEARVEVVADSRCPARLLLAREEVGRLESTLRSLEARQRQVILLRNYDGLSFREIGERMGASPDACRMLLARGLRALTRRLRSGTSARFPISS